MRKTSALILAGIFFLIPSIEISRWIYIAEHSEKLSEARARYFAPYPDALKDNSISTWIFFICLTAASVIFLANWKRGMFFKITGILSAILAFWMLFSLM